MQARSGPRKANRRRSNGDGSRPDHGVAVPAWGNALPSRSERAELKRNSIFREAARCFRKLVREGVEDGSIAPCNPKLAVFALLGAINWVPKWYRDDGEWTAAQISESLVNLVTRSIAAHPDPHRAVERGGGKRRSGTSQPTPQGEKK